MRKPKGQGWRFVQDSWTIAHIVISQHPIVPNPYMLLPSIPTGSEFFTVINLYSAFFSIPVDEANQYLFAFTWEGKQFTWTVMPQSFTESPSCFSQILKTNLNDIIFPKDSTWVQYVDDLLCSSQVSSQEDSIHLLELLALKGHKVSKGKLQFFQIQFLHLGHLISEQELHLDPDGLHGVLSFPRPQTKHQLWGFLGLVSYCRNWIPNFP